ncbi:endo-1,4-beta-xylanase [Prosthecobacter sp. SYSU 5D2]|uniref:endo-1,4-beta-xylanase n=1 Tax=Prosthecobacter sp. SYSU 5D2 TaxID=3134134 RepID=UPI0031FEC61F
MRYFLPLWIILSPLLLCIPSASGQAQAVTANEHPLRLWAQRLDIQLGTAVDLQPLRQEAGYRERLGREFSMITPANAMKMDSLQPSRGQFSWSDADEIINFAERHAQRVHGHTLVWHRQIPKWLESGNWSREELKQMLREHILTVVGRYKGRVQIWDAVNEALEEDGSPRASLWQRIIGPDYIELAFRWAHEADPDAILIYNDYNAEDMGKKSNAVYSMLRDLKQKGVPVHGVGLQMHVTVGMLPAEKDFRNNLQRLADLDLQLHVTELDVRMALPATAETLAQQAKDYSRIFKGAAAFRQLKSFSLWGFTDRHSWIPQEFVGYGAALLWDEKDQAKPAHDAFLRAMQGK